MVVTVMKTTFAKVKPKQIFYRDYKIFNDSRFKDDLKMHHKIFLVVEYRSASAKKSGKSRGKIKEPWQVLQQCRGKFPGLLFRINV